MLKTPDPLHFDKWMTDNGLVYSSYYRCDHGLNINWHLNETFILWSFKFACSQMYFFLLEKKILKFNPQRKSLTKTQLVTSRIWIITCLQYKILTNAPAAVLKPHSIEHISGLFSLKSIILISLRTVSFN